MKTGKIDNEGWLAYGILPLKDKYENFEVHLLDSKTKLKVKADYKGNKVGRPMLNKRQLQEANIQHTSKNETISNTDIVEII